MTKEQFTELRMSGIDQLTAEFRAKGPGEVTREFNRRLIATFRATAGKLNGDFEDASILLLTVVGAKSGKKRTVPLAYISTEGRVFIVASRGGTDVNPIWYDNLLANPTVTVERKSHVYLAEAVTLQGGDRDHIFEIGKKQTKQFADYEKRTSRQIPVIELRRLVDSTTAIQVSG